MLTTILACSFLLAPPAPDSVDPPPIGQTLNADLDVTDPDAFLASVVDLDVSPVYRFEDKDGPGRAMIAVRAHGVVPNPAHAGPTLLVKDRPSGDGYLEFEFFVIPVQGVYGIAIPAKIQASKTYTFDRSDVVIKGVRVFGSAGSKVEKAMNFVPAKGR